MVSTVVLLVWALQVMGPLPRHLQEVDWGPAVAHLVLLVVDYLLLALQLV